MWTLPRTSLRFLLVYIGLLFCPNWNWKALGEEVYYGIGKVLDTSLIGIELAERLLLILTGSSYPGWSDSLPMTLAVS